MKAVAKEKEVLTPSKRRTAAETSRERKLAACLKELEQEKEAAAKLEGERAALLYADVVGVCVAHKLYGTGTVSAQDDSTITVRFDFGNKRFVMPSAFVDGFLQTEDTNVNERISQYHKLSEQLMRAKNTVSALTRSAKILEKN